MSEERKEKYFCPVCDAEIKRNYCKACHQFVKPYSAVRSYYLNESHGKTEHGTSECQYDYHDIVGSKENHYSKSEKEQEQYLAARPETKFASEEKADRMRIMKERRAEILSQRNKMRENAGQNLKNKKAAKMIKGIIFLWILFTMIIPLIGSMVSAFRSNDQLNDFVVDKILGNDHFEVVTVPDMTIPDINYDDYIQYTDDLSFAEDDFYFYQNPFSGNAQSMKDVFANDYVNEEKGSKCIETEGTVIDHDEKYKSYDVIYDSEYGKSGAQFCMEYGKDTLAFVRLQGRDPFELLRAGKFLAVRLTETGDPDEIEWYFDHFFDSYEEIDDADSLYASVEDEVYFFGKIESEDENNGMLVLYIGKP